MRTFFSCMVWLGAVWVLVFPSPCPALGTADVRLTGGPGGYAEGTVRLRLDPWEAFGGEVEAAVSGDAGSSTTRYYRGEVGVRTLIGVGADLGGSRSPASDGLRSSAVYGALTVTGSVWADRMTSVVVTGKRRVYGVRPLDRWEDVEQVSWDLWAAQELADGWVVHAGYTGFTYDRDLDRAALALVLLEFSDRARDLGFTADRLAIFPDRIWGFGLDYRDPSGWRAGVSWDRIVTAVDVLEADTDRFGAETGWDLDNGLGVAVGLDAYVDRDGTEVYPYLHLSYDF